MRLFHSKAFNHLGAIKQALVILTSLTLSTALHAEDPEGTGAFKAKMSTFDNLAEHTVYLPKDLSAFTVTKLPIIAWGNGGCMDLGNAFQNFLTEIASHGYLVIANGHIGELPAPMRPQNRVELSPDEMRERIRARVAAGNIKQPTSASQLTEAIDWAIAQNTDKDSALAGKIDTSKIAVMGQSCGGLQAIKASADPRVDTTVVWNSGTFAEGNNEFPQAEASKADLLNLHAPVAYISGDESDVAFENANADTVRLTSTSSIPVFRAWQPGVGHGGTYREAHGGTFGRVGVAWLNWQLKDDLTAAKLFVGKDCGLCTDTTWTVSYPIN